MHLPRPWETLSSHNIVDDRWLKLRADECRTADGKTISPYYVVEVPDFATIAAVTATRELVMVRQFRQGSRAIHLELPAGLIDPKDVDAGAGAARELREETGYEATRWRRLAIWHSNPARTTARQHLFLAEDAALTSLQDLDGDESLSVELLPLGDAMDAVMSGAIDGSQHVAAVLRVLAELRMLTQGRTP